MFLELCLLAVYGLAMAGSGELGYTSANGSKPEPTVHQDGPRTPPKVVAHLPIFPENSEEQETVLDAEDANGQNDSATWNDSRPVMLMVLFSLAALCLLSMCSLVYERFIHNASWKARREAKKSKKDPNACFELKSETQRREEWVRRVREKTQAILEMEKHGSYGNEYQFGTLESAKICRTRTERKSIEYIHRRKSLEYPVRDGDKGNRCRGSVDLNDLKEFPEAPQPPAFDPNPKDVISPPQRRSSFIEHGLQAIVTKLSSGKETDAEGAKSPLLRGQSPTVKLVYNL